MNMTNHGCPHLGFHKTPETLLSVQTIVAYSLRFRSRHLLNESLADSHKRKIYAKLSQLPTPYCHKCTDCLGNVHACLHCIFLGCSKSRHIHQHLAERNHSLAMDFSNLTIFCAKCDDYVYDYEFEDLIRGERVRFDEVLAGWREPKANRTHYSVWKPDLNENALILEKSRLHSHTGLRGLRNLGNTCFMNVMLQCLVHNPPLRSFFLSDMHNSRLCPAENTQKCLACQMDKLFNQFYSGDTAPILPSEFLWAMWMSCTELVGYAQQDAHEFFIGVLDSLHTAIAPTLPEPKGVTAASFNPHACDCIIHRIFAGTFQSCLTCMRCGHSSVAHDPFLDISLDVRPVFSPVSGTLPFSETGGRPIAFPASTVLKASPTALLLSVSSSVEKTKRPEKHKLGVNTAAAPVLETHSLQECLDQFTHKEKLTSIEYNCSMCALNGSQSTQPRGAFKQLSLKKLPLVLALQLKRFDHMNFVPSHNGGGGGSTDTAGASSKLNMQIKFPMDLDMNRWTTREIHPVSPATDADEKQKWKGPNPSHQYSLFAVIVHHGTLQSGHYVCYVRQSGMVGKWFRFDDHMVTMAEWTEVSNSEAYMLFYIKRTFEYQN